MLQNVPASAAAVAGSESHLDRSRVEGDNTLVFRLLVAAALTIQALALPFAHGAAARTCRGSEALASQLSCETESASCCGAECRSGCCKAGASAHRHSSSKAIVHSCCGTREKAPGTGSPEGCGGRCGGCPCCFSLPMSVAAISPPPALRSDAVATPVILGNEVAQGLSRQPSVPPPIVAC